MWLYLYMKGGVYKLKVTLSALVKEISKETELSNKKVNDVVKKLVETMKRHLVDGDSIDITTLVLLKVEEASERKTYSFKEKKNIILPKRYLPRAVFKYKFTQEIKRKNKIVGNNKA